MYAYKYTLARRAIVATMDLLALNIAKLHTNHWLQNSRKVVLLELSGPVFVDAGPGVVPEERSHEDIFSTYSVEEAKSLYEARDAASIAAILATSSLNGADLLSFREPGIWLPTSVSPLSLQRKLCS